MAEREARAVQHLSVSISAAARAARSTAAAPASGARATAKDHTNEAGASSIPTEYYRPTTSSALTPPAAAPLLKRGNKAPILKANQPDNGSGPHKHKSRQPSDQKLGAGRARKLEGKENEHAGTRTSALQPAATRGACPGTTDTSSGDAIGREIDALSQRIRQRLTAI